MKAIPVELPVSKPFYIDEKIEIYNDRFEGVLPQLDKKPNIIITDPPYPDWYVNEYKYYDGILSFLADYKCRQLVFWSADVKFPLDYTARHVWNKNPSNKGAQYEFIYERNGGKRRCVYTYYMINSTVAASMTNDIFYGHKSQKPIALMLKLVSDYSKENDLILEPFAGSGTTLLAAKKLNRKAIGVEMNKLWCEVAVKRLSQLELLNEAC